MRKRKEGVREKGEKGNEGVEFGCGGSVNEKKEERREKKKQKKKKKKV